MLCSLVLMVTSALWRYFSAVSTTCGGGDFAQDLADSLDALVADRVQGFGK
jgi:hypothetical protein